MAWTSIGMCGALCTASRTKYAPAPWARAAISAAGLIVPRALEACTLATTRVRGPRAALRLLRSSLPVSTSKSVQRTVSP